jgi:prevent-host-death family protein
MDRVNLDDTQETLADVVARAESGETVVITRGSEPVARIEPVARQYEPKKPIDFERLRRIAVSLPYQEVSAGDFMRRLREDARH